MSFSDSAVTMSITCQSHNHNTEQQRSMFSTCQNKLWRQSELKKTVLKNWIWDRIWGKIFLVLESMYLRQEINYELPLKICESFSLNTLDESFQRIWFLSFTSLRHVSGCIRYEEKDILCSAPSDQRKFKELKHNWPMIILLAISNSSYKNNYHAVYSAGSTTPITTLAIYILLTGDASSMEIQDSFLLTWLQIYWIEVL